MPGIWSLKSTLILRCLLAVIILAALLFLPAGDLNFWQGWVYMAVFSIPMILGSVYFYRYDPELVAADQRKSPGAKAYYETGELDFLRCVLTSRSRSPFWLVPRTFVADDSLAGAESGRLLVDHVGHESQQLRLADHRGPGGPESDLHRTVPDRPPSSKYSGAILMFLFTPLALGSYWTLPAFALVIPVIVFRLLNEEKVLGKDLPGYEEYCLRARFRLIPFAWWAPCRALLGNRLLNARRGMGDPRSIRHLRKSAIV